MTMNGCISQWLKVVRRGLEARSTSHAPPSWAWVRFPTLYYDDPAKTEKTETDSGCKSADKPKHFKCRKWKASKAICWAACGRKERGDKQSNDAREEREGKGDS
ncbi:hypothetical protein EYF80_027663 [Liparis tanakae]|uniref:Uncharacterized protein n=1 Tax=Liparis tanakae TaxID=230148 RepID=A0A4Z2HBB1_9TELE|nr:hypothetical protein EYF80_027663 [Liparis tanakae]